MTNSSALQIFRKGVIPVLALIGSWTLDFRESKCFLRGPKILMEMNNYKKFRVCRSVHLHTFK